MVETQATRRLHWLLWFLLIWVGVIGGRLAWLQIFEHDELRKLAQQQQQKTIEIQADRGAILDRNGQPLAKSLVAESVNVNPRRVPDRGVAADLLSRVLDLDRDKLRERLDAAAERNSGFLWVKRKISPEEAARLRSMNLEWVEFRQELRRFYPRGTLAAHVVGSTGFVSDAERGNAGIEMAFDELLGGQPGLARVFTDVKQNPYDSVVVRKPEPGADVMLTIDPNLQYIAERELEKTVATTHAVSGSVVALNPYNGEVLAMANYPGFDPNFPPSPREPEHARSNLAITTPFEPGSVFKVITMAAGLEATSLRPDSLINCGNGIFRLAGRVIHDDHRYSVLSMADVLAKSSNIGAIQVGLRVGEKQLYEYVRRFGFGRKTGIELPGESAGTLRRLKDWGPSSIGSISFGHEVSATSLQLALAGAVVANGGMMVKPRVVLSQQRAGEQPQANETEPPVRVIRPESAIEMRRMMEGVVLRGTGKLATLRGYTSGGKTGSAQIFDSKTRTYTHTYNASFMGFAPVANPQIVIAVTLHRTTGGSAGYGGPVAAPVFREIAMQALRMMDVPKDVPEPTLLASATPSANDLSTENLDGAPAGALSGQRPVSSVTPPPVRAEASASAGASALDRRHFLSQSAEGASVVEASLVASAGSGPRVPDFRGMTLRAVLEEAAASGLEVRVSGSGLARNQTPPPGAALLARTPIRVQFGK